MRFDLNYSTWPFKWFRMPETGVDKARFVDDAVSVFEHTPCCMDRTFSQRLIEKHGRAGLLSAEFDRVLRSIDEDDSCCTIMEVERQHGYVRVGYGKHLQTLERMITKVPTGHPQINKGSVCVSLRVWCGFRGRMFNNVNVSL